jgi:AcrR family transcriptional regulator
MSENTKSIKRPDNGDEGAQRFRILESSARLFAHPGFAGASLHGIADAVSLSKASILLISREMEEIYSKIILDTLDRLLSAVSQSIERKNTPHHRLVAAMEAQAQF